MNHSLRSDRHDVFGFRRVLFYYRFNYANTAGCPHDIWAVAVRRRKFNVGTSPAELRFRSARQNVERSMVDRADLFGRPDYRWDIVALDDYFPRYVTENLEKFSAHVIPNATSSMTGLQDVLAKAEHPPSLFWPSLFWPSLFWKRMRRIGKKLGKAFPVP